MNAPNYDDEAVQMFLERISEEEEIERAEKEKENERMEREKERVYELERLKRVRLSVR